MPEITSSSSSNTIEFDFTTLPFFLQKKLLLLDLNVIEGNWTRLLYSLQRQRLLQSYAHEFSSAPSKRNYYPNTNMIRTSLSLESNPPTLSSSRDDLSSNQSNELEAVSEKLKASINPSSDLFSSPPKNKNSNDIHNYYGTRSDEINNLNFSASGLAQNSTTEQETIPPRLETSSSAVNEGKELIHHNETSSSFPNLSQSISSEFKSKESLSLPADYLWSKICEHTTANPSSPSIKLLNAHGSLLQQFSRKTFLNTIQNVAQFLLNQKKENTFSSRNVSSSSAYKSEPNSVLGIDTFILVSDRLEVILICMLAGWLAGVPCAPLYLNQVRSKFELSNVIDTMQPLWVILDLVSSDNATTIFKKWLTKKCSFHLYQEVMSLDLPSSTSSSTSLMPLHNIMYLDVHLHPSSLYSHQIRTIAVSSATVHRHCFWLSPYLGSTFLQPYKLRGSSHLVSLACLSHGASLILIQESNPSFSMEQWFMLLHTYHIQSAWLRSTSIQNWTPFFSSSVLSYSFSSKMSSSSLLHQTPTKFLLLEEPMAQHLNEFKKYASKLIAFTCCDALAGLLVGLGEPAPLTPSSLVANSSATSSFCKNIITSNYPGLLCIPSLLQLPNGGPHLYVPNPPALRGYYLLMQKLKESEMVINLGSSEDLWYPLHENVRFPLLYRAWLQQVFPQLQRLFFFFFTKVPWLLYTGNIDPVVFYRFIKQQPSISSFALVQLHCLDSLQSDCYPSIVRQFLWSGSKKELPMVTKSPSFTQASISKPLPSTFTYPCLYEYLIHHAEHIPNQIAYLDVDQELTWQQLSQKISLGAMYLLRKGLSPGDHVILSYLHSIDYIVLLHACLYSGILAIPMAPPDLARLTEEVPRWVSVILEFGIQAILCGDGVVDLLHAKPFRHAVKKYAKYCSFPVIHHLSSSQLPIQNSSSTQMLGKDGLQFPAHFLLNPSISAIIHVTFDKDHPKPVCTYTHSQLVHLIQMMAQALIDLHPSFKTNTVVSCVRTYAGFGLIHAIGLGPVLGLPTLLLSTMTFSSAPDTWLQRIQNYPVFITKPMLQFARHLGIDLLERLTFPILIHESAIPLSNASIPCIWEISGAPLASFGSSQCLHLDAKILCEFGVVHYFTSPQPHTVPITSAGYVVQGGHLEVRPWDHHAPLGEGFGKLMFRYGSSSPFRGSLDSYHYGFLAQDHVFPICQTILPYGQGVIPIELMEAIMEQHVILALFLHVSSIEKSSQWVAIIELMSSMYYSTDSSSSLDGLPSDPNSETEVLIQGVMAITQGYYDIQRFFGIQFQIALVVHPGSLPRSRLNEKQRGLIQQLSVVKEFSFDS